MDSSRLSNRSHSRSPTHVNRQGNNWNSQNYRNMVNESYQSSINGMRSYSPNRTSYHQTLNNGSNQFRQGENWRNNRSSTSPYRFNRGNQKSPYQRNNWNGTIGNYNWPNWQSDNKSIYHNATNAEIFMQNRNQQLSNQQTRDILRDRPLVNLILLLREQVQMMHQSFDRNNCYCGDDIMEQENRIDYFCQRNGINFYCNNNWNNWQENQMNGTNNYGLYRRNFIEVTLPYSETGFGRQFNGQNSQVKYGQNAVMVKFNNDHAHNWEQTQNLNNNNGYEYNNGRQYLQDVQNNMTNFNSSRLSKGEGFYGNQGLMSRLGNNTCN